MTTDNPELPATVESLETGLSNQDTTKKIFVEPELSTPIDVIEATTFFQLTDSGGTI